MVAKSAAMYNPAVEALYDRLRARGRRGDVAYGHCGIQGNVLDFWAAWRKLPLHDAALDLAETFHP